MISLQQVNARSGSFTLTDISFDVAQGAYGVVIGPAGSGKTTLLETIAGVVRTQTGKILLGGFSGPEGGNIQVARMTAKGALDATFGAGGIATVDFGGTEFGVVVRALTPANAHKRATQAAFNSLRASHHSIASVADLHVLRSAAIDGAHIVA